ncbi:MAG TPA: hypothetical protein VNY29_07220 [Terriglobales bacterium]|nr:hypothetical protein [Terriglobales bacterium]
MKTVTLALVTGLGVFALVWWRVRRDAIKVRHGDPATFTPPDSHGNPVPFEHRHQRYMNVAEVMVTLASASLVFVPSSRLSLYRQACVFALILLGLCVLYSVGFMALLTYFYERFLYDDQTYRPWKYGLLHGLGFGALFCFALAYIVLAGGVANAVYALPFAGHPPALPFNLQFPQ